MLIKAVLSTVVGMALVFSSAAIATAEEGHYGVVVTYRKNTPIHYPDFTLLYTGEDHTPAGNLRITHHNFTVAAASGEQKISWSSGLGLITETSFKVDGKQFYLDLAPRQNHKFLNSGRTDLIVHDEAGYQAYRE